MLNSPVLTPRRSRVAGGLLALSLGWLAAALLLAAGRPAQAGGNLIFVSPGQSIQAAINGAAPGDTVFVGSGQYTESLTLSTTVNLLGSNSVNTFIRAMPGQRVITVTGAAVNQVVLIKDLTLQDGDVDGGGACPQNCGGGMLITNGAQPRLQYLVFRNNAAWQGGGLYANKSITLTDSLFQNNTAVHNGGGLNLPNSLVITEYALTLVDTDFISNTAGAFGGGAFVFGPAHITGGLFERNKCTGTCEGGGSATRGLTLIDTIYLSNTSASDGGGAANYVFLASLDGGSFEGNRCTTAACVGGGLFSDGGAAITATAFISNAARFNGGGVHLTLASVSMLGARFERNSCTDSFCSGGGAFVSLTPSFLLTLVSTDFYSNTADLDGGGLRAGAVLSMTGGVLQGNTCAYVGCGGGGLNAGRSANLSGVRFTGNTAQNGGGGAFFAEVATVEYSLFEGNDCLAASCVGGGVRGENDLTLTAVQFVDNNSVGAGGGLAHVNTSGTLRVVNGLFADNTAGTPVQALWFASSGSGVVLHTTFANTAANSGAAVGVGGGSLGLTNTIVTTYSVGFALAAGALYEDYTLFFGVTTPTAGGVSSGSHHPTGNPLFVNPATDNYHLTSSSPAISAGADVGVVLDFEDDSRTAQPGFDLGYDEYSLERIYVPIVMK